MQESCAPLGYTLLKIAKLLITPAKQSFLQNTNEINLGVRETDVFRLGNVSSIQRRRKTAKRNRTAGKAEVAERSEFGFPAWRTGSGAKQKSN
jgi:hypothetical protein